jgi:DNA-binding MarR family transcriptional regulator
MMHACEEAAAHQRWPVEHEESRMAGVRTRAARSHRSAAAIGTGPDPLAELDVALLELRRLVNRPGYRKRLLGPLGRAVELSTVRVLHAIDQSPEAPSIGEIATLLAIDPSTASRLVEQRVSDGLVRRERTADDGRRTTLELTAAGAALLTELAMSRRTMLTQVTAGWEPDDIRTLDELLMRLIGGFDALERTPADAI